MNRDMEREGRDAPPAQVIPLEAYRQMLVALFCAAFVVAALFVIIGLLIDAGVIPVARHGPVLVAVAFAGALGALFSALLRMYTLKDLPRALLHPGLRGLRNRYLIAYASVPPLVGFLGASVVYLAVLGGIIDGDLFPNFQCKLDAPDACNTFIGFFAYGPAQASDYAKALVLGFASGFSERLVHDVLKGVENAGST